MRNVDQVATAIANRQRILEALPGTAAQLCERTKLAQPTVSKLLRSLITVGKAYQSGWTSTAGGPSSAVFTFGKSPPGFRLPERPARMSRDEYNAKRKIARMTREQLDELNDDDLWPKQEAGPTPPPHYLFAMYGPVPTCCQPEYCKVHAAEDYANKTKCPACTLQSVALEWVDGLS
jgi:hypothetical protein